MKYAVQRCFLILALWGAMQTPAASDQEHLEGAYIEFPPLSYTDSAGNAAGSYIENVNRLASEAGYHIQWQSLPIDRIYLYLEEGEIDVWLGSARVPALSQWTREPDFTFPPIRLNAYHDADTPDIQELGDLEGENLILIRGYTYLNRLSPVTESPGTHVDEAPDHEAALRMLRVGRGDYLLDFQSPVENALLTEPFPKLQESRLMEWDTALVFSKHTDNLDRIIRDFEQSWANRKNLDSTLDW